MKQLGSLLIFFQTVTRLERVAFLLSASLFLSACANGLWMVALLLASCLFMMIGNWLRIGMRAPAKKGV